MGDPSLSPPRCRANTWQSDAARLLQIAARMLLLLAWFIVVGTLAAAEVCGDLIRKLVKVASRRR